MSELLSRPPRQGASRPTPETGARGARRPPRRPAAPSPQPITWAGLLAALRSAGLSLLAVMVLVLVAWASAADSGASATQAVGGGLQIWLVGNLARLTVPVDRIPGLEATAASVKVVSDQGLPLVVERSMFWDASYYGGHTANAVDQPETRWTFAEGFQGFFDTYILIANAEATPTTATLTFLREGAAPVVRTVPVGAFARRTVYAGDYPELKDRAFGIVVEATQPIIAERAMYFSTQPGRLWAGGHANTGIVTPSRSWFHAEGATGTYFSTFILLSNPQTTPAQVTLRYLLPNGDVIVRTKHV